MSTPHAAYAVIVLGLVPTQGILHQAGGACRYLWPDACMMCGKLSASLLLLLLLLQVQNVIEMPHNDELTLLEASRCAAVRPAVCAEAHVVRCMHAGCISAWALPAGCCECCQCGVAITLYIVEYSNGHDADRSAACCQHYYIALCQLHTARPRTRRQA